MSVGKKGSRGLCVWSALTDNKKSCRIILFKNYCQVIVFFFINWSCFLYLFAPALYTLYLHLSIHLPVHTFVPVAGAGELQQRENGFAVRSQDHGEPH